MENKVEICFICLNKCELTWRLDDSDDSDVKFLEKLTAFFPCEIWKPDFLICGECTQRLNNAYDFLQICLKSEKYHKTILFSELDSSKNNITSDIEFKILENIENSIDYDVDTKIDEKLSDSEFDDLGKLSNLKNHKLTKRKQTFYTCDLCNKVFKLKRTLNLHITRIHIRKKKKLKQESHTGLNLDLKNDLIENFSKIETEIEENNAEMKISNKVFKIEQVSKFENDSFETNESENYEDNKVLEIKDISPIESDKITSTHKKNQIKLLSHKKVRKKWKTKNPETCEMCNIDFPNSKKYAIHIRIKHTDEKPFKCDECDSKYFSKQALQIHKRKHNNEKPYICSTCGKSFVSSNDLWQHNKIHDVIRQYACDKCDKSFKTHSNLRTHKHQMHLDPALWKFVCTVCGKKFPLNTNLIKHMRRHEGVKPYVCALCEKGFVEKVDLQVHLLSHSNERQFGCNMCQKAYKKRETLRRHWKVAHNIGNMKIKKPEKKITCPKCPKMFTFNNKLQRHLLTHTGEKPVACDFCDKRFRDNYDRNTHFRKDHGVQGPL